MKWISNFEKLADGFNSVIHSLYFSHKAHKTQRSTCETSCKENKIKHIRNFEHTWGALHMPQHLQEEATGDIHRTNFPISIVLNKSRLYFRKKTKWNLSARTPKNLAVNQVEVPQHFTFVEIIYLNTDMCKFESSQSDESGAQLADSWKACSNPGAFKCGFECVKIWPGIE